MTFLWLPIGLILPTLCGYLLLRITEGPTPVLQRGERWVMGAVLGTTFTLFCTFCANAFLGVRFSLLGFLGVQVLLAAMLGGLWWYGQRSGCIARTSFSPPASAPPSRLVSVALIALGLWTLLKLAGGTMMLVGTPIYLDDTVDNWNYRGKIYYEDRTLTLNVPATDTSGLGGISSYPPTVPLLKAWLATLNGGWDEGLINSPHVLWFLAGLALLAYALRRYAGWPLALTGAYVLSSLPLYFSQGVNAYADVFVSVHVLCAVWPLLAALQETDAQRRLSLLRVSAVACALLLFTKNEGVAIFLPVLGLLILLCFLGLRWTERLTLRQILAAAAWFLGAAVLIGGPWIIFKWLHGLPFGNAKPISTLALGLHPEVPMAIVINTLFEGNWILLYPLLITLLLWRWRAALLSPLVLLLAFLLLTTGIQWSAFLLTNLATEAIYQTGLARGILQQAPVMVLLGMLLLKDGLRGRV